MGQPELPISETWPYLPTLIRLALALGLGLFIGLERERRGKEAGVRTFAFAAVLGCLGGLLSDTYALLSITLLALLVFFLNWHSLRSHDDTEMTTSAALLVTGFIGVLAGKGHTFTPVAVGIATAWLLAWKQPLSGFSTGLTEEELRSAILLGIISFVIYPVLPHGTIDPWGLIDPRTAWITVILIAAIGFVNYLLLKGYGTRGVEMTGFFAGLVNSTVAVTELSARVREEGRALASAAYRGVILAVMAMLLRNFVLFGLLAPQALLRASLPTALMLIGSLALAYLHGASQAGAIGRGDGLPRGLSSPFSLKAALQFGFVFLVLDIAGTLAQRYLGQAGFYAVSIAGGLVSSASAVASAGTLAAHGKLSFAVAANGAVLASLTSALVNLPVVARVAADRSLTRRLALALGTVTVLGVVGLFLSDKLLSP
jgi:uncharacterized membrane protein (DUF4010 family)